MGNSIVNCNLQVYGARLGKQILGAHRNKRYYFTVESIVNEVFDCHWKKQWARTDEDPLSTFLLGRIQGVLIWINY